MRVAGGASGNSCKALYCALLLLLRAYLLSRCRKGASVDDKLSDFFMKDINKVRVISMDAKAAKDARCTLADDLGRTFYAQLDQLRY